METAATGRFLTDIRPMTDDELEEEGWTHAPDHQRPAVMEFADGTTMFASQDAEGNGPGALFGRDSDGVGFRIT